MNRGGAGVGIDGREHHRASAARGRVEHQTGVGGARRRDQGTADRQSLAGGDVENRATRLIHRIELGTERGVLCDGDRAVEVIDTPDGRRGSGAGREFAAGQGDRAQVEGLPGSAVGGEPTAGADCQDGVSRGSCERIGRAGQSDRTAVLDVDASCLTEAGVRAVRPTGHRDGLRDFDRTGGGEVAAQGHRPGAAEEEVAGAAKSVARCVRDISAHDRGAEDLVRGAGVVKGRAGGDGEGADVGARSERTGAADAQGAVIHGDGTREGVRAGEDGRAGAGLRQTEISATDDAAERQLRAGDAERARSTQRDRTGEGARAGRGHERAAVERERLGADERVAQIERGAAGDRRAGRGRAQAGVIGHGQGAGGNGRRAGVGVHAVEHGRAGARLFQRTRAADYAANGQRAGAIEDERPVVGDHARAQSAARAARADAHRAARDRGGADVGVGARQDERTAGRISREATRAGDRTAERRAERIKGERRSSGRGEAVDGVTGRSSGACRDRTTGTAGTTEITDDEDARATGATGVASRVTGATATAAGVGRASLCGVAEAAVTAAPLPAQAEARGDSCRIIRSAATAAGIPAERAGDLAGPADTTIAGLITGGGRRASSAGAAAAAARAVGTDTIAGAAAETLSGGARTTGRSRFLAVTAAAGTPVAGYLGHAAAATPAATTDRGESVESGVRAIGAADIRGTTAATRADRGGVTREIQGRGSGEETARATACAVVATAPATARDEQIVDGLVEVDGQRAGEGDGVGERAHGTSDEQTGLADRQRSGTEGGIMIGPDDTTGDRRTPGVGIRPRERHDTLAGSHRARTADRHRDDDKVGAVNREDTVVGDGARTERTGGRAIADAQGSAADRRGPGVGVGAGVRKDACAELGHGA